MSDALPVWLEPGFDRRVAVWLAELPGAFASGADEAEALANAPLAAWVYVDRMREHGETLDPGGDRADVVESVPTQRLADGYEVNAIFAAEQRPAWPDEVEAALRRAGWMREDLLRLLERVGRYESEHGGLPGSAESRSLDEVLRHVATAETWFASRLDPTARYAGPSRDGDVRTYLDATHSWARQQIAALAARDPAAVRQDGKGEAWTVPKVLRRLVYHAIDHLDELERRLDVADGLAERLTVSRDPPDVPALADLLFACALRHRSREPERLARMLASVTETVSLYDGARLVAFARVTTDGVYNGYVSMVVVHPRYGRRGIGRRLMLELMRGRDHLKWVLEARPGVERFYAQLGFEPAPGVMARRPLKR